MRQSLLDGKLLVKDAYVHQDDEVLVQAAPVQNTWYFILGSATVAEKNVRLEGIEVDVQTTGEDLDVRVTIDGVVYQIAGGAFTAGIGTQYGIYKYSEWDGLGRVSGTTPLPLPLFYAVWKGRTCTIEVRKTTANGAGTLQGRVTWSKIP